jgi:hypothetical protein
MKPIVAQLRFNPEADQREARQAQGKPKEIQEGVQLVLNKMSERVG